MSWGFQAMTSYGLLRVLEYGIVPSTRVDENI